MKKIFKGILYIHFVIILKIISLIRRPYVVIVFGNSKKSFFREKLNNKLKEKTSKTRKEYKPYNTWFGVVLDYLNIPSAYSNLSKWIGVYFLSWYKLIKSLFWFPKYLVLQGGIDEEGENKWFLKVIKPDMIVFTDLDASISDDFRKQNIQEKEFNSMVSYLNKKSKKEDSRKEELDLDQLANKIIAQEKNIGVVNQDDTRLQSIGEKLIKGVYIKI